MMIFWTVVQAILSLSLARAETRGEALAAVQDLIEKNQSRLEQIDGAMKSAAAPQDQAAVATAVVAAATKPFVPLGLQRQEHLLRQDFLDRLILQVDRYFRGGDLKAFLEVKIQQLAKYETTAQAPQQNLALFLTNLAVALKDLPEKHEAPLDFIEGYMKFSSIIKPQKPEEFSKFRHYSNGRSFVTANPTDRERVGDLVESKIRALSPPHGVLREKKVSGEE